MAGSMWSCARSWRWFQAISGAVLMTAMAWPSLARADEPSPTAAGSATADPTAAPAEQPAPAKRAVAAPRIRFSIARPATAKKAAAESAVQAIPAEPPPPDSSGATHEQVSVIRPGEGLKGWTLACFAPMKDSRLVAVLVPPQKNAAWGAPAPGGEQANENAASPEKESADDADKAPAAEVRLLDADGKLQSKWALDFTGQAVNVGPDGTIYVAGDGSVARFDATGKLLARAESPQVVASKQNPDERKQRARSMLEAQRNAMQEIVKNLEAQKTELEGKKDDELSDDERQMKQSIDRMIEVYKKQAALNKPQPITEQQVEQMAAQLAAQERRTNALAVSDKFVYATGPASKGYGYRVWRTDLDFQNAVAIVDGLSGCCGQMDIQCCGDEIVVAENSRHRVVRYDAEGKKIASFGKRSRDGAGDCFGGCCNPMNTRAVGDKLYVAESDGQVKLFSRDGTFEGLVAVAQVRPGCKSSTIAVSPDENRVYYIDVQQSAICVLDRKPGDDKQAAKPTDAATQ